jgi:hypothetical protein
MKIKNNYALLFIFIKYTNYSIDDLTIIIVPFLFFVQLNARIYIINNFNNLIPNKQNIF